MSNDNSFSPITEANGKIVEGHHRYVCSEILTKKMEIIKGGINISMETNYLWSEVIIEENDWDSECDLKLYVKEYDL